VILAGAIDQLDTLDEDSTIFVRRPWSAVAEARVSPLDEDSRVPAAVKEGGFEYFLEVHVAREVLEDCDSRSLTREERIRLLLYYAENDAYPEWLDVP
jgi:hypothetical protein